jgi:glycosyltransferase involved in cell wall biosynthesis
VVYYVSDYSPKRYTSNVFNSIYLWLDRFCATHADYIWDVSPAMMPARLKNGLQIEKAKPLIQVPNALFPFQISYLPLTSLKRNSLLFAGTIGPENGLDLAIEALAMVKKDIPDVMLHILGSGLATEEEKIQRLIHTYGLEDNIKQYGFIADLKKISDISKHCMIGLAPYRALPLSIRWYADATKMRLYFANGLPAITTQVPPLGKEAFQKKCALVVKDNPQLFANAILTLLTNPKLYQEYRANAIAFAKENTWENTYSNALKEMRL